MSPLDRRQFMGRSLALLGAGSLGALAGAEAERDGSASAQSLSPTVLARRAEQGSLAAAIPFDAPHQAGILTPAPAQATFAALDAIAPDRQTLAEALQQLSTRARQLTRGGAYPRLEVDDPPADSGVLGPINAPDALTVTIAFGGSLFDGRYGLADRRPRRLTAMPNFPNDNLDPARSHGDMLLQICAGQRDTVVHTLRELVRSVRGSLQQRWAIDGFSSARRGPSPHNSPRNLFAFRDGTANPDVSDAALMNRLIWVQPGAGEPAWTAGGTYQVVRAIRMHAEFWDRVGLAEQEEMIGRHRDTGAPLGGSEEFQDPRYDLDPQGKRIPLTAHIRLANPRTTPTADQRILRRGFNYHRGFDAAGQLDQGLVFVAFNQDVSRQFATIQRRLAEEPMIDYITPVGGGYFFAPPGSRSPTDWVGSGLFA
jgi:deferrochelatase/peroxidase EfeB